MPYCNALLCISEVKNDYSNQFSISVSLLYLYFRGIAKPNYYISDIVNNLDVLFDHVK